jgi:ATP-binding cassette subfamily F protein uup
MHLISLEAITKAYPETPVLHDTSLGISAGQRMGVIGRNGSGKSTLLRTIAGTEEPDAGRIVRMPGLRVSTLTQDPTFPQGATVGEVVGDDRATIAMADRLGIVRPEVLVGGLSGGQQKRLALALTLAAECDLLILDEPTNHLDVDTIDWLEDHLLRRTAALVLVTHDRYLLDRVATRIVEVHDQSLHSHRVGYEEYLEARAAREEHEATVEHRRVRRLRTELEWLRRSPKARTSKARSRVKQAHELMATKRREARADVTLDLPSRRIGSKVVNLHNVGKRYDDRWVLRGVTYRLSPDARIGVVGPNGAGKTTLLRLMAGQLPPDAGKVTMGSTIVPGWYGQDPRELDRDTRLLAAVREHGEVTRVESGITISATQLLDRFLFTGDSQRTVVGDLSGGERRRLELLLVLIEAPNLLFLDEPTNDLDLDTLNVLEEYLDAWPGALVVASHDRYFLDRVCNDIFSIEADGSVRHHPGGWSAYWADRREHRPESSRRRQPQDRRAPRRRRLSYDDQHELNRLDKRIPALEEQRGALARELATAGSDYTTAGNLSRQLEALTTELDQAETRWLELTAEADRLRREADG